MIKKIIAVNYFFYPIPMLTIFQEHGVSSDSTQRCCGESHFPDRERKGKKKERAGLTIHAPWVAAITALRPIGHRGHRNAHMGTPLFHLQVPLYSFKNLINP